MNSDDAQIKMELSKLGEQAIQASKILREHGHHQLADSLIMRIGYATGLAWPHHTSPYDTPKLCIQCKGAGIVRLGVDKFNWAEPSKPCPNCKGRGYLEKEAT